MKYMSKELEIKKTKEKVIKDMNVRDYMDISINLKGSVKENYICGFELSLHLLEKNSKEHPGNLTNLSSLALYLHSFKK